MKKIILSVGTKEKQMFLEEILIDSRRLPKVGSLLDQLAKSFPLADSVIKSPNIMFLFRLTDFKNTTPSSVLSAVKSLHILLTAIVGYRHVDFKMETHEHSFNIETTDVDGNEIKSAVNIMDLKLPISFLSNRTHLMLPVTNGEFSQFFCSGPYPVEVMYDPKHLTYIPIKRPDIEQSHLSFVAGNDVTLNYSTDVGTVYISYQKDILSQLLDISRESILFEDMVVHHTELLETIFNTN